MTEQRRPRPGLSCEPRDEAAPGDRRARPLGGRLAVGAVLVLVGLLVWIAATFVGRSEPRSYQAESAPPTYVALTAGHVYSLGTAGGLSALSRVVDPAALQCTISPRGGGTSTLQITPETNVKALHRIATFVSPISDDAHVVCEQAGAVYVDDADGSTDWAGVLRLLATIALTVGVGLAFSGLASLSGRSGDRDDGGLRTGGDGEPVGVGR